MTTPADEIPTVAEQGVPGFEATTWAGIIAPAGVPAPIVETLNKARAALVAIESARVAER